MSASNTDIPHFDIIIVGGGMVGLSLACLLRRDLPDGISIALMDSADLQNPPSLDLQQGDVKAYDPRVSAVTPDSERLLTELGVWQSIVSRRACAYTSMEVWDGEGTGKICFDADEVHAPHLGSIVENRIISSMLLESLLQDSRVELVSGANVEKVLSDLETEGRSVVLQDGRQFACKLLIGADGAFSRIRQELGFATREWDYGHSAIVTTIQVRDSHDFAARQVFLDSGPLAFLPLLDQHQNMQDRQDKQGPHFCSIVWSCLPELAEELMALDDSEFASRLATAFEHRLGPVVAVAERYCFPLRQRHASQYVQAGVALIGDAAHTIHPLAGQGVNLGFQDAEALASVLRDAIARGDQPGDEKVLSRYQRQRKGANLGMMVLMEGFKRLFGSDDLMLRSLRNSGLSQVNRLPVVKNKLIRAAMGL